MFRIAIDGTASAGKGSIARGVARELNLPYVDTGSMYIITSLTDQHLIAEYHLTKSNRLIFDRYTLVLDWWDMYGDNHNFKCKLLKKQF